jgi:transcription elongation GreA/GreB family factor
MNKRKVVQAIIARLREDIALYHKAAMAARAEATHEQSKAENKYDTRGLEASYLARGQSRQVSEIEQAISQFEKLPLRDWPPEEPIDCGALVELQSGREKNIYFLGPRAGGTEVMFGTQEILVITPESPLGRNLVGKRQGDKCRLEIAGSKQDYLVSTVW